MRKEYVFVSSWSKEDPPPAGYQLAQYEFDPQSGRLKLVKRVSGAAQLSVLHLDARRNVLYGLLERADFEKGKCGGGGGIDTFRLNGQTGESEFAGRTRTFCANPAYLTLDRTGEYLLVAHHASHSYITKLDRDEAGTYCPVVEFDDSLVELFSVNLDGTVGELLDAVKHTGCGPKPRQRNPHPHCVVHSPSGNLFAVCDKGNDGIYLYRIDREQNKLAPWAPAYQTPPGTMPRYCVFHPTLPFFYHNCEGTCDVFAFRYGEEGALSPLGSFGALLPENRPSPGTQCVQQALCMHPSGKYLYDVVCGAEVAAVYQISQEDGRLTLIQNQQIGYGWSRGAAISPDGRYLLTMSCEGNKIVVFQIGEDGRLAPTGYEYDHTAAADAVFWSTS